jgi:hypothetical protein
VTRAERSKWTRDFYAALAVELDSHVDNGSGFIFGDNEDDPKDLVELRLKIVRQEVARLQKKGRSL